MARASSGTESILKRRTTNLFSLLLAFLTLFPLIPAQAQPDGLLSDKNVLILHAHEGNAPVFQETDRSLGRTLQAGGVPILNQFVQSLNLRRGSDPETRKRLIEYMRAFYRHRSFDLIITMYPEALDFVLNEGRGLFPNTPPILALYLPTVTGPSTAVGFHIFRHAATLDMHGTLEMALKLVPGAKRVYIVTGAHEVDRQNVLRAQEAFKPWEGRLEFHYLNQMSLEQAQATVANAPQDAIVLLFGYSSDVTGKGAMAPDLAQRMSEVSTVPVFGLLEASLGHGIVGGSLLSFDLIGSHAGRLALEILRGGVAAEEVGHVLNVPSAPMFDWRQLTRWHLPLGALPPGSIVINREYTLWQQYHWHVLVALTLLVVQGLTIFALLVQRKSRYQAEELLTSVVESSLDALISLDRDLRITSWNPAAERLFGYPASEVKGQQIEVIVPPESRAEMLQNVERIWSGESVSFEADRCRKDGSRIRVSIGSAPLRGSSGEIVGISVALRDITEQRRADERIRRSEAQYRELYESLRDGYKIFGMDGRIRQFNESFRQMLGYTSEELLEMTAHDITPAEWHAFEDEILQKQVRARGYSDVYEKEYRRKDGTIFPVELRTFLLKDAAGGHSGMWAIVRDISERKRAQQALAESQAQILALFHSTDDLIWSVDPETFGLVTFNMALSDYFFNRRGIEIRAGMTPEDLLPPEIALQWRDYYTRALRDGPYVIEYSAVATYLLLSINPLRRGRDVFGISVFGKDITERKKADQALRESEERFRQVAETVGDFIWEVDTAGLYRYTSPSVEKILGYRPEELIGKRHFYDLFPPEVREELKAAAFAVFARKETLRAFPNPSLHKEGNIVELETSGVPVLDPNGKLLGYRGTDSDVTHRNRSTRALRASEAQSTAILNAISGNMAIIDRGGTIVQVNTAWQKFAAANGAPDSLFSGIGMNYLDVCRRAADQGESLALAALDGIEAVLAGTQNEFSLDYPCDTPTEERWFSMAVLPLQRAEGGAVVYHRDVTAQRHADADAERLRRELAHISRVSVMGELTASLAHELNQPLTAIATNASAGRRFLSQPTPALGEIGEILADVIADAQRAGEVIRRMRSLLKKDVSHFAPLDVNDVIREVVALTRTDALIRHHPITLELAPDLPWVHGDRVQLQQVLLNLVMNAMEAMERQLHMRTTCETHAVQVGVRDVGPGILPEQLPKVFDSFFTTKATGMGMGLALSRSIVEAHGGKIWAANNPEGGATFWFTLPVEGPDHPLT